MPSLNWIGKEEIITLENGRPSRNAESSYKLRLGNKWADLAGDN